MKRLVIFAGLALALGLGFASAQNITKSLQGSQDPRGPVGQDTSNAMYFPGHINAFGQIPATSYSTGGCGSTQAFGPGTDVAGQIQVGSTSCSVTFGSPFNVAPNCVVTAITAPTSGVAYNVTTTTTSFKIAGINASPATTSWFYICIGNQ